MTIKSQPNIGGLIFGVIIGGGLLVGTLGISINAIEARLDPKRHATRVAQEEALNAAADAASILKAQEVAALEAAKEAERQEYETAYNDARIALENVRASLRDPSSAQFRNIWTYRYGQGGGAVVCGEVNATNGFGGYVGFVEFLAVGSTILTADYDHFEEFQADYCAPGKRWFQMRHF